MDWWKCWLVCAVASCGGDSTGTGSDGHGSTVDDGSGTVDDGSGTVGSASVTDTAGTSTSSGEAPACGESGVASTIVTTMSRASGTIAGDIDGDGNADLIVGVPGYVEDGDPIGPGRVRVVLGPLEGRGGDIDAQPGFSIVGEHEDHLVGGAITSAGDVNGDGLGDVLVGIQRTCDIDNPCSTGGETDSDCEPPCAPGPYRAYVVYGKTDSDDVDLAVIAGGTGGFAIEHSTDPEVLAEPVLAALGDVDADGLADVAIAAPLADDARGRVYVVFGRSDTTTVDLADLGSGGFSIAPELESGGDFPIAIAGAGDVDGDGTDDIVVSDYYVDQGRGYVVFAGEAASSVALSDVAQGVGGFAILGEPSSGSGAATGQTVSGLGDVDGDGLAEVGISAPNYGPDGGPSHGRVYVVHGRSDTAMVDLAEVAMGTGGFAIDGVNGTGTYLGGGADHDGDGVPDVFVADVSGGVRAFVVAGKADGTLVRLGEAGSTAVPPPDDSFGPGADSLIPDIDCDGRADLMFHKSFWADSAIAFALE